MTRERNSQHAMGQTPPPFTRAEFLTHACENITFLQLLLGIVPNGDQPPISFGSLKVVFSQVWGLCHNGYSSDISKEWVSSSFSSSIASLMSVFISVNTP